MVNFVKDLPILLTDGDYPYVDHSADGIRVTIQTLRQVAKEHGIPAGQLLRGISASDECQFDEGKRFCLPLALNVNPFEINRIANGYFAEHE